MISLQVHQYQSFHQCTRRLFSTYIILYRIQPRHSQRVFSSVCVWRGIKKEVRNWCCKHADCQTSKIIHHVHSSIKHPPSSTGRFADIYVNLVGALHKSIDGMACILAAIDNLTRWSEAFPIPDMKAEAIAETFLLVEFVAWALRIFS